MNGVVIKECQMRNGIVLQIVRTDECGGRYYLVMNGEPGFHSLDIDRVEAQFNKYLRY